MPGSDGVALNFENGVYWLKDGYTVKSKAQHAAQIRRSKGQLVRIVKREHVPYNQGRNHRTEWWIYAKED